MTYSRTCGIDQADCTALVCTCANDLVRATPTLTCDNGSAPAGATNTLRGLTRSSGTSREGLAMKATRRIIPTDVPKAVTAQLRMTYDSWPERFKSKVQFGYGCWDWTGCINRGGYGSYMAYPGKTVRAHRHALTLSGYSLTPGLTVDHLCRNRTCVRPDHLQEVRRAENTRRGYVTNATTGWCRSGRHRWIPENITFLSNGAKICRLCRNLRVNPDGNLASADRTHCPQGHPYDDENTGWSNRRNGRKQRRCRACNREAERRRARARRARAEAEGDA